MKAKDLAEQLLQNPYLDVITLDTEYNPEIATGLQLGKVVDTLFCTCEYISQLQKNVDNFENIDLEDRFLKENACQYTSLEKYIEMSKGNHARRVAFLERAEAAPFVLSLI